MIHAVINQMIQTDNLKDYFSNRGPRSESQVFLYSYSKLAQISSQTSHQM